VVNAFNKDEDMREAIVKLNPIRWKVFQCLEVDGENAGKQGETGKKGKRALRSVSRYLVSGVGYQAFLDRHASIQDRVKIKEPNDTMRDSYFLLDERMRFLDCSKGGKQPSVSIFDSIDLALQQSGFNQQMFDMRDGEYYKRLSVKRPPVAVEVETETDESSPSQVRCRTVPSSVHTPICDSISW